MKIKGYAMYAYTLMPDEKYKQWKIQVVTSKEERDRVTAATGLKFTRTDGDDFEALGDYQIAARRYVEQRGKNKGKKNPPPKVYDIDNNEITDKIIGNGSKVIVEINPYKWSYKNDAGSLVSGISADFKSVKVVDWVEYGGTDDDSSTDSNQGVEESKGWEDDDDTNEEW